MSQTSAMYRTILEKVQQQSESWNFNASGWRYEKGIVELDKQRDEKRLRLVFRTWAVVHKVLRHKKRGHLSVDIQWGSTPALSISQESWQFYAYLSSNREEIEREIKCQTELPGLLRIRDNTPRAKWMMEAGFVLDENVNIEDWSRHDEYANWLATAIPVVRKTLLVQIPKYALHA